MTSINVQVRTHGCGNGVILMHQPRLCRLSTPHCHSHESPYFDIMTSFFTKNFHYCAVQGYITALSHHPCRGVVLLGTIIIASFQVPFLGSPWTFWKNQDHGHVDDTLVYSYPSRSSCLGGFIQAYRNCRRYRSLSLTSPEVLSLVMENKLVAIVGAYSLLDGWSGTALSFYLSSMFWGFVEDSEEIYLLVMMPYMERCYVLDRSRRRCFINIIDSQWSCCWCDSENKKEDSLLHQCKVPSFYTSFFLFPFFFCLFHSHLYLISKLCVSFFFFFFYIRNCLGLHDYIAYC